jgi:predicted enzyme related to lactoylglutathione lyase
MAQATTSLVNKPAWIDLSSADPAGSRDFYAKLLGWQVEVNPDPQYGGYAIAKLDGKDVAGIGPTQAPGAPTAWNLYIGTDDAEDLAKRVTAAGGTVVAPPFDVGEQGRMAVFQDPSGAFISGWQPSAMFGFQSEVTGAFEWAELNAWGIEKTIPFYTTLFGWTTTVSPMGEDQAPYTEFKVDGESVAGAWEMNKMVPAGVPSYWQIYFSVDDVDASYAKAVEGGAREMLPPQDFPGGRFAILSDPQGAGFGLLTLKPRS